MDFLWQILQIFMQLICGSQWQIFLLIKDFDKDFRNLDFEPYIENVLYASTSARK